MRLTRLYVDVPFATDDRVELPAEAAQHVARVLRARIGDSLRLFRGDGREFDALVESVRGNRVVVLVGAEHWIDREPPVRLTLMQCIPRGDRMDWIVQKATELGVARIVPLLSRRSVVKLSPEQSEIKTAHWRAVAASACEQCGRTRIPEIERPCRLDEALDDAGPGTARFLFDPDAASGGPAGAAPAAIEFLIGPEGGFEPQELDAFRLAGFRGMRLGPRILRTETAAIAALAWLQTCFGDFPPTSDALDRIGAAAT